MTHVELEGFRLSVFAGDPGWIPPVKIIPTPATRGSLRKILPPLLNGHNLLLVGDAGVGKNALIYYINSLRRHPTIRYSFNEDTLPEDLVGSYRLQPGGFIWCDGPLTLAMRRGATFVADEMNLASPDVLKRFQSVFADRRLQILEGDGTILTPAQGFSFIATQNPAEGFEGRKQLPREIQKYLTTVHMDPHSDDELVEILAGLYPSIPDEALRVMVTVNRSIEDLVTRKKIGMRDLERYHFNLRNLKRLAARVEQSPETLYREMLDIYVRPFRSEEDRGLLRVTIREILQAEGVRTSVPAPSIEIHADPDSGFMDIGRARLHLTESAKQRIEDACNELAIVPARLEVLEAIARALQFGENLLLESDSDVEPEAYVRFFATLLGADDESVGLSRGMHTSDVLGGLKPAGRDGVSWVDGPLTKAVRRGRILMIQGLEAAGPELVEKMNMLLDEAGALVLPPESGETEPLHRGNAAVFGIKYFRLMKSSPTISRAFRNRFSAIVVPPVVDVDSLRGIIQHGLGLSENEGQTLSEVILRFHMLIRKKAENREIGVARLEPYRFGLTNLSRLLESLRSSGEFANRVSLDPFDSLRDGVRMSYTNEIADPRERSLMEQSLEELIEGKSAPLLEDLRSFEKKKLLTPLHA